MSFRIEEVVGGAASMTAGAIAAVGNLANREVRQLFVAVGNMANDLRFSYWYLPVAAVGILLITAKAVQCYYGRWFEGIYRELMEARAELGAIQIRRMPMGAPAVPMTPNDSSRVEALAILPDTPQRTATLCREVRTAIRQNKIDLIKAIMRLVMFSDNPETNHVVSHAYTSEINPAERVPVPMSGEDQTLLKALRRLPAGAERTRWMASLVREAITNNKRSLVVELYKVARESGRVQRQALEAVIEETHRHFDNGDRDLGRLGLLGVKTAAIVLEIQRSALYRVLNGLGLVAR